MKLAIKDMDRQSAFLARCSRIFNQEMKNMLAKMGDEVVADARNRPQGQSFYNHTGNLRASIGYGVFRDGKKIAKSDFALVSAPEGNGHYGQWLGRRELTKVAAQNPEKPANEGDVAFDMGGGGMQLVVVAGMPYAAYVEGLSKKDVLGTAKLHAYQKLRSYLQSAKTAIQSRIAKIKL